MKEGIRQLVGRTIRHVVVKASQDTPRSQVFLVLDDGTYYELYSDGIIRGASSVSVGSLEAVRAYMPGNEIVLEA